MSKREKIKKGDYLLGKLGSIRRVGQETDFGFEYLEFANDTKVACRFSCSGSQLRNWGTPISEEESRRLIPTIDQQIAKLEEEESWQSRELTGVAILHASDDELIAELQRRGYVVGPKG